MTTTPCQIFRLRRKAKRKKARLKQWYQSIKEGLKCEDCGFAHPAALHFHHLSGKRSEVSLLVTNRASRRLILEEIAKCIPLCANCHAIRHYDGGYVHSAELSECSRPRALQHPEFSFDAARVQETPPPVWQPDSSTPARLANALRWAAVNFSAPRAPEA